MRGKTIPESLLPLIERSMRETKDARVYRKLQVIELRAKGKAYEEIVEITGYTRSWTSKIVSEYLREGIEEFVRPKWVGNHRNLSKAEEESLLAGFRESAERGELVDLQEIASAYAEQTGKPCSKSTLYKVLHRHGWRKVMPRARQPKKEGDEAIGASKK